MILCEFMHFPIQLSCLVSPKTFAIFEISVLRKTKTRVFNIKRL
jgi:hypothetical protein